MNDVATWTLNQYAMITIIAGIFGFIGFVRGIRREFVALIFLIIALLITRLSTDSLIGPVNRFYRLQQLGRQVVLGADNLGALWEQIGAQPDFISSPTSITVLKIVIFAGIALLGYIVSERFAAPAFSLALKILGMFVGLINGIIVAIFLLLEVFREATAVIQMPTGEVQQTLTSADFLARLIGFSIFILIVYGLYSASGRTQRRS